MRMNRKKPISLIPQIFGIQISNSETNAISISIAFYGFISYRLLHPLLELMLNSGKLMTFTSLDKESPSAAHCTVSLLLFVQDLTQFLSGKTQ